MQNHQENIEQEANWWFKLLYDNQISVQELIEKMKQLKDS